MSSLSPNSPGLVKPQMAPDVEFDKDFLGLIRMILLELRNNNPFFGIMASELWIAGPAKNIPTIGVSKRGVVVYNEEYLKSLPMGEVIGAIIHEALHVGLDYWDRFDGLNPKIANWAHDYSINDIIHKAMDSIRFVRRDGTEHKFKIGLPQGTLWDKKYSDMAGEQVYTILYEGIKKRTQEIRKQRELAANGANDPQAQEEMRRQKQIQDEIKKSMAAAGKLLSDKLSKILANQGIDQDLFEIKRQQREALELLKGGVSTDLGFSAKTVEEVEAESVGVDVNSAANSRGGSGFISLSIYDQIRSELGEEMKKAMGGFLEKEVQRITDVVDSKPTSQTLDGHLQELSEELDEIARRYFEKVQLADPNQAPGQQSQDQGNSQGGKGQPNQDQNKQGQEQGQGNDGQESDQANDGKGQGKEGAGEQKAPGEQGDGTGRGQEQGQGQEGQEGQAQGAENGQAGEPGENMGGAQNGTGKPMAGGMPSGSGAGKPDYEQIQTDVANNYKDMMDEIADALRGGKPFQGYAGGDQMIEQGAWEQAMEDFGKSIGAGKFDGDVDVNCDDIPGNPFKKETPDETKQRKREMLERAVIYDAEKGGKGIGTLPDWARREVDGILNPPLTFSQKVRKFVGQYGARDTYSRNKPSMRNTFQEGFGIFPGRKRNSSKIYFLFDVSGSMMNQQDLDNLRRAMGYVKHLATSMRMEVVVVQCDAGVSKVMNTQQAMSEIMKGRFEVVGQGGSDLTDGFETIWNMMSRSGASGGAPIMVFTDGAITVPEEPPSHIRQQVLWVTNKHQKAPTDKWGEHLVIDESMSR